MKVKLKLALFFLFYGMEFMKTLGSIPSINRLLFCLKKKEIWKRIKDTLLKYVSTVDNSNRLNWTTVISVLYKPYSSNVINL